MASIDELSLRQIGSQEGATAAARGDGRKCLSPRRSARRLAAEGVGSFFLFACVIGSGIMAANLSGGNDAVALLGNTAPPGAILFVLITMLGPISGAHMNPAVSLVAASRGELPWRDAGAYIARAARVRHPRRLGGAPDVRSADAATVGEGADTASANGPARLSPLSA